MNEQTIQRPATGGPPQESSDVSPVPLPAHLIGLSDKNWALWRTVGLRGSGFPIGQVLELAAPECAVAVDHLLAQEEVVEQARKAALTFLRSRIDLAQPGSDEYTRLVKTLRAVRDAAFPAPLKACKFESQEITAFQLAYQILLEAYRAFQQQFERANLRVSDVLQRTAGTERFREAVVWQNRHALHTALDPLLRFAPGQGGSRRRQYEVLITNYLQRYCTKNDSIGFFGPIGWTTLVEDGAAMTASPGPELLASRSVFLEFWGIEAIAEVFARDPALRPWLIPRLMPHMYVDGTMLLVPFARPVSLHKNQLAVLQACDGVRTAGDIARVLLEDRAAIFTCEADIYAQLEQLVEQKRLMWRLAITPEGSYPERALRRLLEGIGDETLRNEKLNLLLRIEQAREGVGRAAGNAAALDRALGELETVFTSLAGTDPTRNSGQTYGARTLVYEDCRRDIAVTLGPSVLQVLEQPLTLLLQSARWLTYELSTWYTEIFANVYQEIAAQGTTDDHIDFSRFWLWMLGQMFDDDEHLTEPLTAVFQERWAAVLGVLPEDTRRVAYTSAQLRPLVQEQFPASRPGWNVARYHSPDILLSATGPDAVRRGDYQIILGELHVSMNTLQLSLFLSQHPGAEQLIRDSAQDLPEARLLPVLSKHVFPSSGRVRPYLINPKDVRLIYTSDTGVPDHARIFSTGELVIEKRAGRLLVCTRDHSWECPLLEAFGELLVRHVFNRFQLLPDRRHTPRITVDEKVVIAREAWSFGAAEIPGVFEKEAVRRFLEIRRWKQSQGLPRFAFFRVPDENKPCFLDFESPMSVAIFAKMVRLSRELGGPAAPISLSEMLPDPDHLWLPDVEGQRYTSELRMVALDQVKAFG